MSTGPDSTRRGQVIVLSVPLAVVFVGIAALTADVGQLFLAKARLQNAADAAAFAGAQVLLSQQMAGATEDVGRLAALAEARQLCQANEAGAGLDLEFGHLGASYAFVSAEAATVATAVSATARRREGTPGGPVQITFASLFGLRAVEVSASAVCEVASGIAGVTAGLGPFAVPKHRVPGVGEVMTFYPADDDEYDGVADQSVAPGCWGLLNLDGGAGGTTEILEYIENGYPDTVRIPRGEDHLWLGGASGFRASMQPALEAKIGEPMILAVYDELTGTGATAVFRVVGFVRITLTAVDLQGAGKEAHVKGVVEQVDSLHGLITGGGLPSANLRKIQLVQ